MEALLFIGIVVWCYWLTRKINTLNTVLNTQKNKTEKLPVTPKPAFRISPELYTNSSKKGFSLEHFFGKKFFAVAGVLSIVLSIGFFITWAFSNGMIGPVGRVSIGVILSLLTVGLGYVLRRWKETSFFSDKISAIGIGGLIITTYLARHYQFEGLDHTLLDASQSFWIYLVVVGMGVLLSLCYNSRFLANFTIIGGVLAPILSGGDSHAVGLLSFLTILSVGTLVVSLYRRWPELLGILLLGATGYEIYIYIDGGLSDQPVLFLAFVFAIHCLLGVGGLIRSFISSLRETWDRVSGETVTELCLFMGSLFIADIFAFVLFTAQGWDYLEWFILLQGIELGALSLIFSRKKIPVFRDILLCASIISLVFSTILAIDFHEGKGAMFLAILLAGESIILKLAHVRTQMWVFSFFAKIVSGIAFLWLFSVSGFWEHTTAMTVVLLSMLYGSWGKSITLINVWSVISTALALGYLFYWNFSLLGDYIGYAPLWVLFVLPLLGSVGLYFATRLTCSSVLPILSAIGIGCVNVYMWDTFSLAEVFLSDRWVPFVMVLFSNAVVLSSFFIKNARKKETSTSLQTGATLFLLSISTVTVWTLCMDSDSKIMSSMTHIIWAFLLMVLGIKYNWLYFRYFGIGIFIFIISRFYIIDIWEWSSEARTLSFAVLGVALLSLSYIYGKDSKTHKKNNRNITA